MATKVNIDIAGMIKQRKEKREAESVRDAILVMANKRKMEEQKAAGVENPTGLSPETIELFSKIKGTSREIISTAKDFGLDFGAIETKPTAQKILDTAKSNPGARVSGETRGGLNISRETPNVEDIVTEATAKKQVDLSFQPSFDELELQKRELEKKQDLRFKAQEAFIDVQKNILKGGTELDSTEKQKLIFAQQGSKTVKEAQDLLTSDNFVRNVFGQGGGPIGKLSTVGSTDLRKYNTAVTASIFSFVFANSGAQVSDKERKAFEDIYGLQIGDTLEVGKFKNQLLADFFQTAKDILDPEQVAGLTVTELNGKLNEIQGQLDKLGKGGTEEAKTILDGMCDKALGVSSSAEAENKIGRFQVEVS